MRSLYLVILGIILSIPSFAQPGYQGKKLSFAYNLSLSPAFTNPNFKGNQGLKSFNTTHTGRLEYVLSRRTSLALKYSFARTSMDYSLQVVNNSNFYSEGNPMKIYSNGVGLVYRIFNSSPGNLPPIGKYWDLEVQVINSILHDELVDQYIASTNSLLLGIGFGKQKVIFDRLILDYGLRGGLLLDAISDAPILGDSEQSSLTSDMVSRMFFHQMVNVRLAIGFLAL